MNPKMHLAKTLSVLILIGLLISISSCRKADNGTPDISLVSPADGSSGAPPRETFRCTAVGGAVAYVFYFSDGINTFSDTSATNQVTDSTLRTCSNYTWLVIARRADGSFVSTPNWHYSTTGGTTIPCPQEPANGSTGICPSTTFSWTSVPGGSPYTVSIRASGVYIDQTVSGTSVTLSSLPASTGCTWWVQAATGVSSPVYSFTTVMAPALSEPAAGSNGVSRTPSFSWSATCTNNFFIDISTVRDFSSIVKTEQVSSPSYTLPVGNTLNAFATYYWRVRVADYTSVSSAFSFTTGLN